jgi:hypothetical protein
MYHLVLLIASIAWAVGCWALRESYGRTAVLWLWVGCGTAFLLFGVAMSTRRAKPVAPDPERDTELARRLDLSSLEFHPTADPARFPVLKGLTLPGEIGSRGTRANVLAGSLEGTEVLVLDVLRPAPGDKGTPTEGETVVVFPGAARDLPGFFLRPAPRAGSWFESYRLGFDAEAVPDDEGRQRVEAFDRLYSVQPDPVGAGDAVRPVFALDTIAYLASRPDWKVQSQAGHLVLSRHARLVGGEERAALLAEADALRQQLTRPATRDRIIVPEPPPRWRLATVIYPVMGLPVLALVSGLMAGLFGFITGVFGTFFGGGPVSWMLEAAALGTAYGPLAMTVVIVSLLERRRLKRGLAGAEATPEGESV